MLHQHLKNGCMWSSNGWHALSIYGSTAAQSNISHHSITSYIASTRADEVAEFAAKEAKYKIVQDERNRMERIKALENQHKKELELERSELDGLQAEKEMEATRARFEAYSREITQMGGMQSVKDEQVSPDISSPCNTPI